MSVVVLTDDVAALRGSDLDEASSAQEYSPLLRRIDDRLRLLAGISLVREREHHGLSEEEAGGQPIQFGRYDMDNPHTPGTYLNPRTVVRRSRWVALPA